MVSRPFRRAGSGCEGLQEGQECLGSPHKGSRGFLGGPAVVKRASLRAGRGWEAITKSRKAFSEDRECSGGPHEGSVGTPEGLGVVGRPSQRVGRTSRRVRSGWEALLEGR